MRELIVQVKTTDAHREMYLTNHEGVEELYSRVDNGPILANGEKYVFIVDDTRHIFQVAGIFFPLNRVPNVERSVKRELDGQLQKVKSETGAVIGRIKKYFPESKIWLAQAVDIYERAKALQTSLRETK